MSNVDRVPVTTATGAALRARGAITANASWGPPSQRRAPTANTAKAPSHPLTAARCTAPTITASHALLDNYTSELYPSGSDPVRASTKGRLDAAVPVPDGRPVPVTAQVQVDNRRSGASDVLLSARATHAWNGSTVTHELAAQSLAGQQSVLGGLQLMSIGILGEYLGRLFIETKQRPLFLLDYHQPSRPDTPGRPQEAA
jgi:hypothetical protein